MTKEKASSKFGFIKKICSAILNLSILAVVLFGCYVVYQNPKIADRYMGIIKESISSDEAPKLPDYAQDLYAKVDSLGREVNQLGNMVVDSSDAENINLLNERYAAIEKQNLNIIDSKADVATVLGLIGRMDKAEERMDKVAKVSDQGALVLTAVMLVRDRAMSGDKFEYEAMVLEEIAAGDAKIKDEVASIVKISSEGVASDLELVREFEKQYALSQKTETEEVLPWQDRLKAKLKEFVQVKKIGEALAENKTEKLLAEAQKLVLEGNFIKAASLLKEQGFEDWVSMVDKRVEFDRAASKISAYSLAVMKVKNLKGEK